MRSVGVASTSTSSPSSHHQQQHGWWNRTAARPPTQRLRRRQMSLTPTSTTTRASLPSSSSSLSSPPFPESASASPFAPRATATKHQNPTLDEIVTAEALAAELGDGQDDDDNDGIDNFSPSSSSSSYNRKQQNKKKVVLPKHGVGIRVEQLYKRYDSLRSGGESFVGAAGFDLEIAPNKLTALVGPSGSGKTTFLRLVSGLEDPTSGRVYLGGRDVTDLSTRDRRVGVVFQGYALFKHMTVAENIKFGPRMLNLPGDPDARVRDLLELVELPHVAGRYPSQLSGGQKQRVALARALAAEPKVLLLDEPFSALDPEVRAALRAGLRDVLRRAGVTAVMVSHDQAEAFEMADDVVVFRRGAPAAHGAPDDLRASPGSPFAMDFVHEANKLPSGCALVRNSGFATLKPGAMCAPRDVECVERLPAAARDGDRGSSPSSSSSSYTPVTVLDRSFAGNVIKYRIRCEGDGVELEAHVPSNATALTPAGGARRGGRGASGSGSGSGSRRDGGGGGGEASVSSSPSSSSALPPLLEQLEVGSRAYARCPPDRFMGFQAEDLEA